MLCEVESNRFSDYLPLYQSGEATLGSDEYCKYDVYSTATFYLPLYQSGEHANTLGSDE